MTFLEYDRGSILIRGEVRTPYGKWDPRVNAYRAMAIYYRDILDYFKKSGLPFNDKVPNLLPHASCSCNVKLRSYQKDALNLWIKNEKSGVIVLPTGAGKTIIALKAIEHLNTTSLVIVPTLDLVEQWRSNLMSKCKVEVGVYGGGEELLKPITVSTYDSAYLRAEQLGNRFMFLIFDEVHHLPAPSYSQIAEIYIAPYRMGLTATPDREDNLHRELPRLVGDIVFTTEIEVLTGEHLSPYSHEKIYVKLTKQERRSYDKQHKIFTNYLQSRGLTLKSQKDFQRFIMRTGRDREARIALLARNNAIKIALNSEAKIKTLGDLLQKYANKKIIIFTLHNQLVYSISKKFFIPSITFQTPKEERTEILDRFRAGQYKILVTSQVLDEGIDVPDASVGIIISGTGSTREYIQRLGRLLRKIEGKKAKLLEIIAQDTVEMHISKRRHR